jgi:opacity protein-like surface antigen
MKRIMVIGLLLLAVAVGAQDLRTNNQALLFSFGGLSDMSLGNFDGGPATGIGFKLYNAAGTMAVRPMVMFGIDNTEDDPGVEGVTGAKEKITGYGAMIDLIKPLVKANLAPYVGAGAGYMVVKDRNESAYLTDGGDPDIDETTISGFTVRGILGVEWFVKKNVSVSGEYRLSFTSGKGEVKSQAGGDDEWDKASTKETTIGIGASGLLTLSFYIR